MIKVNGKYKEVKITSYALYLIGTVPQCNASIESDVRQIFGEASRLRGTKAPPEDIPHTSISPDGSPVSPYHRMFGKAK